jgi:geranylgeranyl reductase family protein
MQADVLVIGAGPAGSAAARSLASKGAAVVLVDQFEFPRDKICGDGLVADSFHALDRLGLKERVLRECQRADVMHIRTPNQGRIELNAELASAPRAQLDKVLQDAAVEAGAQLLAPYKLSAACEENDAVTGAGFSHARSGTELHVNARFTLLATGAAARPLELFGVCERKRPSGVAARVYCKVDAALAARFPHFMISLDNATSPGYRWIFPLPENRFNLGVGCFYDGKRLPNGNVRELFNSFIEEFPPAKLLVNKAREMTELKGAPVRTALTGAKFSRPGLLVVGEAAGMTYSFSGEGIGKALESGIIAAEILMLYFRGAISFEQASASYAKQIRDKFDQRFRSYKSAQSWAARRGVCDFLAWRANRGRYVRTQLEGILAESLHPGVLFSLPGMLNALIR